MSVYLFQYFDAIVPCLCLTIMYVFRRYKGPSNFENKFNFKNQKRSQTDWLLYFCVGVLIVSRGNFTKKLNHQLLGLRMDLIFLNPFLG